MREEANPLMMLAAIFIGIPTWFFLFPFMLKGGCWGIETLVTLCTFTFHLGSKLAGI